MAYGKIKMGNAKPMPIGLDDLRNRSKKPGTVKPGLTNPKLPKLPGLPKPPKPNIKTPTTPVPPKARGGR